MKRCAACGWDEFDDAQFCGYCGGTVAPVAEDEASVGGAAEPLSAFADVGVSPNVNTATSQIEMDEQHAFDDFEVLDDCDIFEWHAPWMLDCGEDERGPWAALAIDGVEHRFRYCAPGTFTMGSPSNETSRLEVEGPQHQVTLTQGFWLGEAPVTQRQWAAVAGANPSGFEGGELPVEHVSWEECKQWIAEASARAGGLDLRFPTEAEWEYACRAGTTGANYRGGSDDATLDGIAWFDKNSGGKTHPVKQKAPNAWGLYDMLGNVWEWCADDRRAYDMSGVVNPTGRVGAARALRGGSWCGDGHDVRAARRYEFTPHDKANYLGFRLAQGPSGSLGVMCAREVALGEAAKRSGQRGEARAHFEAVLSVDPAHTVALLALEELTRVSMWQEPWMLDCGEDAFGAWAAVDIAGVEHRFRYCAPGVFKMGSRASEHGRFGDEGPQHAVTLTQGFWLGEAPVTQRQWAAVAGSNPSEFEGDDLPVEQVSWDDCEAWMAEASARAGGLGLRFPTEAEWEYACRAGTTGATYRGRNDAATLDAIAWYGANSGGKTNPVKQKAPNAWGLYDMLGNVWEWCADRQRRYSEASKTNPKGRAGHAQVNRGGSWFGDAQFARSACRDASGRDDRNGSLGFRLARG